MFQEYRSENQRLRDAFKPVNIKVAEELDIELTTLKRKHRQMRTEHKAQVEEMNQENDELQSEVNRLEKTWTGVFEREQQLSQTMRKLTQAEADWEAERREKLAVMDELEEMKKKAYGYEMLCKNGY